MCSAKRIIGGMAAGESNKEATAPPTSNTHRRTQSLLSMQLYPKETGGKIESRPKKTCHDGNSNCTQDNTMTIESVCQPKSARGKRTLSASPKIGSRSKKRCNGGNSVLTKEIGCQAKSSSGKSIPLAATPKAKIISKRLTTWGKIHTYLSKCKTFDDMFDYVKKFKGPEL